MATVFPATAELCCMSCRKQFALEVSRIDLSKVLMPQPTSLRKRPFGPPPGASALGQPGPQYFGIPRHAVPQPSTTINLPPTLFEPFYLSQASIPRHSLNALSWTSPTSPPTDPLPLNSARSQVSKPEPLDGIISPRPVEAAARSPRKQQQSRSRGKTDANDSGPYLDPRALRLGIIQLFSHAVDADPDTDYPLCARCWKAVLAAGKKRIDALIQETNSMRAYLHPSTDSLVVSLTPTVVDGEAQRKVPPTAGGELESERGTEWDHLQSSLRAVLDEEERLGVELQTLRAEAASEAAREKDLNATDERMRGEEEEVASRLNDVLTAEWMWHHEEESKGRSLARINEHVARLNRFHSLTHLFPLNTAGPIGVIRGLRVGRLPTCIVPPMEVNCGCGLLIQLVQRLGKRHNLTGGRYHLKYAGAESTIEVQGTGKAKPTVVDFYIKQKLLSWRSFDEGCVAFAGTVKQLSDHLLALLRAAEIGESTSSRSLRSPQEDESDGGEASHVESPTQTRAVSRQNLRAELEKGPKVQIEGPLAGGCSVQYGVVSDEVWSRAMLNVMVVIQWCLSVDALLLEPSANA